MSTDDQIADVIRASRADDWTDAERLLAQLFAAVMIRARDEYDGEADFVIAAVRNLGWQPPTRRLVTARENLARHLGEASKLAVEQDAPDYWAFIARELIEVGWRPPARAVSTVEELRDVAVGTVVRSRLGTIACRYDEDRGVVFGDDRPFAWSMLALPATVLHEGGA